MQIVLGCSKVLSEGHINSDAGIFGILNERIKKLRTGAVIPAKDNTSCRCRRTPRCSIDCKNSIYGIRSGHRISYRNKDVRI